jgi:hypothetical protein
MEFLDKLFKNDEDTYKDYDVFISHSTDDKVIADEICSVFEENGLKCWIAPRDIPLGRPFTEGIMAGIISSKVFVLIFTESSKEKKYVKTELELAFKYNKTILSYNLTNKDPEGDFNFALKNLQWLEPKEEKEKTYEHLVKNAIRLCKKTPRDLIININNIKVNKPKNTLPDIISIILLFTPLYSLSFVYMGIVGKFKEWIAIGIIYIVPLPFCLYSFGGDLYNATRISFFIQLFFVFWILALVGGLFIVRKEFLARKTVLKMMSQEEEMFDVYVNEYCRV